MDILKGIILILVSLVAVAVYGQETLQPCSNLLTAGSDEFVLTSRLLANLGVATDRTLSKGTVAFRMFSFPAWDNEGESVVTIYLPREGDALVESSIARKGIMGFNMEDVPIPNQEKPTYHSRVTAESKKVDVDSFKASLQRELATRIERVMSKQIRRVRYPSDDELVIFLEVPSYAFTSYADRFGDVCGSIPAPKEGTTVGNMVAFGEALIEYSKAGAVQGKHELNQLSKLLGTIN